MEKGLRKQIFVSREFLRRVRPAKWVLLGYAWYILIGWVLLCMPFSVKVPGVSPLDHLFTATSAVSTTGLTTVSVSDTYTLIGQLIVLSLIQLGGIGYMTFGSFIILAGKRTLTETRVGVSRAVFSLPESLNLAQFIKGVIVFTFVIELIGALSLYGVFRAAGQADAVWSSVFHSISSFCTAGFSLYNSSFETYKDNFWLHLVVGGLSYIGAIGFIVCLDCWNTVSGRVGAITLTSKIILWTTCSMTVVGTLLIAVGEPSLGDQPLDVRILEAFFQAMTAMTTVGFNTVGIGGLSKATVLVLIVLMVIGSSPSGTGGGLKCTTFSAFLGVMRSAIRGRQEVRFWDRPIPVERVWTAVASVGFYLMALILGTYLLDMTEASRFDQNFFEAASALGTVGLSMGITGALTNVGKVIVILLMFCGRLGPLTFGMALFGRSEESRIKRDSDLAV